MKSPVALAMHRERLLARLDRAPIRNPRVFGSVAGGMEREGSDLDLWVDVMPGATLFALGELQIDLEDMLGVHVDLLADAHPEIPLRCMCGMPNRLAYGDYQIDVDVVWETVATELTPLLAQLEKALASLPDHTP